MGPATLPGARSTGGYSIVASPFLMDDVTFRGLGAPARGHIRRLPGKASAGTSLPALAD
jgi:hypothetical protein